MKKIKRVSLKTFKVKRAPGKLSELVKTKPVARFYDINRKIERKWVRRFGQKGYEVLAYRLTRPKHYQLDYTAR